MDRLIKRKLGQTGLLVSPLGLGTVKFGRNEGVKYPLGFTLPDENALADLLDLAKDLGINLLDTAPAYGLSEERLGRLLKGQRQDWVIAGKFGEEFENGQSRYDFTPSHCMTSIDRSLKRLGTDYLDILLIHSDGRDEEILNDGNLLQILFALKQLGKVRAIGASTKTLAGALKALDLLDVVMLTYAPDYTEEEPALAKAAALSKGVLIKKALGSGHTDDPAKAIQFALNHKGTSAVIAGTINPEHLRANAKAARAAS